jgi:lipoprotein-anchoring transpeptidase ErfK/SrfK
VVVPRALLGALVLIPVMLIGLGVADVAAFDSRAAALEQSWAADQAAGLGQAQLAPARAQLQALRDRRLLLLPYSALSGAVFMDPFGEPESLVASRETEALAGARQRAEGDLARLKDVGGPNYADYQAHARTLAGTHSLAGYTQLARAWETEAQQLGTVRDQLSTAAGGLNAGLPKDMMDGLDRLQSVIAAANRAQLSTDPATQALTHVQAYLKLPYPALLDQHAAISGEVRSAGDTVQHRVDIRVQADQLLGRLTDLAGQATKYGVDQSSATAARTAVQTAEAAGDDSRMDAAIGTLKQVVNQLSAAVTTAQQKAYTAALASDTACVPGAPAQLVIVHLATQKLVAYNNGCPFLNTPVTTGRPAVRTYPGTFTIHSKYGDYLMRSPWPKGSSLWYPDTVVHDAMLIVPVDGVFIHSAEWEPASAYGPGSQNGPFASHGCIHVQNGPLATLFNWAQVGATVIVTD